MSPAPSIIQLDEEVEWLAQLLLASGVSTILTIGVYHGGLEYQLAKRYHTAGRPCFITGLDIALPAELWQTSQRIREQFPLACVNFAFFNTRVTENPLCLGRYDFVFIDADHRYESVKGDFELVKPLVKMFVGFHDIVDSPFHRQMNCYVSRFWRELKQMFPAAEKIANPNWGGIGVIYVG